MAKPNTIKNFKRRKTSTRGDLHRFIKAMREANKGDQVEAVLLEKGFAPCVAREWGTPGPWPAAAVRGQGRRKRE